MRFDTKTGWVTLVTDQMLCVCVKPTLFGLLRTTICVTLAAPLAGRVSPLGAFMCNWTLWGKIKWMFEV